MTAVRMGAMRVTAPPGRTVSSMLSSPWPLLLIGLVLFSVGCSFSTSARSASDSSDSSESSSRSSTSKERHSRYREDVRTYVAAHAHSPGGSGAFERQLGELAQRHGITNWEDDETTFVGIGEGLREAGVDEVLFETFKARFSRSDSLKIQAIQQGYDTVQ